MPVRLHSARVTASTLIIALSLSATLSAQSAPQQPSQNKGVTVDPSAAPLAPSEQPAATQPAEPQLPSAPEPAAVPPQAQKLQQPPPPQTPLGAAAAGPVKNAGGAASRPAGNAIAPAKQHQYRSLVIKLGALAAAGIAVGTVYGLSHATSSTPPHSASSSAAAR